jgi:glycosyltransferase involved in cell wall biosynthesis
LTHDELRGAALGESIQNGTRLKKRRRRSARVSCVIPALNEERNIAWVLERLPSVVDDVILVDGDSTDRTVAVSRAVRPDLRVVGQDRPGKGAALRSGFSVARGEVIVMLDADRSMDPQEIGLFLGALAEGNDLAKGSRFVDGGGTTDMDHLRRWGNLTLCRLVNTLYGGDFTDLCYGYMAFRRDQLPVLALNADGFEIETEIVVRALQTRLRVAEVPSVEAARANGESHLRTWRDGRRVLATTLSYRFRTVPVAAPAVQAILTEGTTDRPQLLPVSH